MSQFYGTSRTNYFRVKDEALFKKWADKFSLQVLESEVEPGTFMLLPSEYSDDGMFTLVCDSEPEDDGECLDEDEHDDYDYEDLELSDELPKHLAPGSVAIVMAAGAENLDVAGWAQAFDHTGRLIEVSTEDIYGLAEAEFGVAIHRSGQRR